MIGEYFAFILINNDYSSLLWLIRRKFEVLLGCELSWKHLNSLWAHFRFINMHIGQLKFDHLHDTLGLLLGCLLRDARVVRISVAALVLFRYWLLAGRPRVGCRFLIIAVICILQALVQILNLDWRRPLVNLTHHYWCLKINHFSKLSCWWFGTHTGLNYPWRVTASRQVFLFICSLSNLWVEVSGAKYFLLLFVQLFEKFFAVHHFSRRLLVSTYTWGVAAQFLRMPRLEPRETSFKELLLFLHLVEALCWLRI